MVEVLLYCTRHTEEGQAVLSWLTALPVHLTQVVAGTGVGVTRVDDLLNDITQVARSWSEDGEEQHVKTFDNEKRSENHNFSL